MNHESDWLRSVLSGVVYLTAYALLSVSPVSAQLSSPVSSGENLPRYEVAVIKLSSPDNRHHVWNDSIDRVVIQNYSLRQIIGVAYNAKSESQIVGGPKWIDKQAFDITAKIDDSEIAKMKKMSGEEKRREKHLMLQSFLSDRFQVQVSRRDRILPVYALVVAKSGTKLTLPQPSPEKDPPNGSGVESKPAKANGIFVENGHMTATAVSLDDLADDLTGMRETGDRVVINQTGLVGRYDFTLNWTQDRGDGVPTEAPYPGLITALREQLGLQLKSEKAPVDVITIEAATEPALD